MNHFFYPFQNRYDNGAAMLIESYNLIMPQDKLQSKKISCFITFLRCDSVFFSYLNNLKSKKGHLPHLQSTEDTVVNL